MNKSFLESFPIWPHVPEICNQLQSSSSHFLVLTAETGAGKSTVLPAGLLENFDKKILITEPRRLAVIGAANRVASLLDEECGQTVGYKIHLEKKTSNKTRLEFVTEAIMVKQLQQDPFLEDVNLVVIDEFHERTIHTDLILAFLKEAVESRDDLFVIIMSATINSEKLQQFLDCPVLQIPGRKFPVQIEYKSETTLEKAVISNVTPGQTILAFIPSLQDIKKSYEILSEHFKNDDSVQILMLHSSVSFDEQKQALIPSPKNICRIILSSAIAETSLTVPGVSLVIDSGLSRVNKINLHTGMQTLVTERETQFSAEQRCGRAGREKEGRCIRLWNKEEKLLKELNPEILRCDLGPVILECAQRGIAGIEQMQWLDCPPKTSWNSSLALLQQLDLISSSKTITPLGSLALHLPLDFRLSLVAIKGFDFKSKKLSSLAQQLICKYGFPNQSKSKTSIFIQDLEHRLEKYGSEELFKNDNSIPLILFGFFDRLGKKCDSFNEGQVEYQFASGRKAVLQKDGGNPPQWIVCPNILGTSTKAIIFDYETISPEEIQNFINKKAEEREHSFFKNGKISKVKELCLGKIVLKSVSLPVSQDDYANAWISEIQEKGFSSLPADEKCHNLLLRCQLFRNSDIIQDLEQNACEWLLPFLSGKSNLDSKTLFDALYWYLDGSLIDQKVPNTMILENGTKCKILYEKYKQDDKEIIKPVIEIIIQRAFGCKKIPEICGQKVLIRLLSPASRPLQITEDLEGFWSGAWKEICKEMKGRYPKHDWSWTGD